MARIYKRLNVPYTAEEMFDLVVDIERYPQFVPGWRASRITRRQGDGDRGRLLVDQVAGEKGIRFRFETQADYRRPTYLRIASTGRPFQYFVLRWQFRPRADGGCLVIAHARYRLRDVPFRQLAERLFNHMFADVVESFHRRARRLYGVRRASHG
jgi:coenzyme Q-binding protein COQ10